ncbi:DUF4124 domain-containing protein [Seongchinamella sediminis]|uniref:DUF4124 domain-containing protein n=1 Tax=Seongchinamella sediminis TaxID=2283635 RepID=A0A3L7E103_9GAMM|nr:DUF4124 domain-containing protein [Seongchinamella sediminis]RLQ23527.1 DUF4124 domain-containing protein [Seongchinamella sediminis]
MLKHLVTVLLCGTLFALPALAQIYKTTDAEGNVVFTDQPPAGGSGAEAVELPRTNTTPPPPVMAPVRPGAPQQQEAATPVSVSISSPADETTIPKGGGIFEVVAAPTPGLAPGQTLQLLLDGQPHGAPQTSKRWKLENVLRGPHDLVVRLLDSNGAVLASSESVRVYVLRPGI